MTQKTFFTLTGVIFTGVSAAHILRLLFHWEIVIGGWTVPYWISFVGAAAAGYIAYNAFHLRKKRNK